MCAALKASVEQKRFSELLLWFEMGALADRRQGRVPKPKNHSESINIS